MHTWEKCLLSLLEKIYLPLKAKNIEWVIIGSCATALQKISVVPKDIDILLKSKTWICQLKLKNRGHETEKCRFWNKFHRFWKKHVVELLC